MRTCVDLPDSLFREAKQLALSEETTLKQLIAEGLQAVIERQKVTQPASAPDSTPLAHRDLRYGFSAF